MKPHVAHGRGLGLGGIQALAGARQVGLAELTQASAGLVCVDAVMGALDLMPGSGDDLTPSAPDLVVCSLLHVVDGLAQVLEPSAGDHLTALFVELATSAQDRSPKKPSGLRVAPVLARPPEADQFPGNGAVVLATWSEVQQFDDVVADRLAGLGAFVHEPVYLARTRLIPAVVPSGVAEVLRSIGSAVVLSGPGGGGPGDGGGFIDAPVVLRPHPGPQTDFLASEAFMVLYGGAGGGGKALRLDEPVPTPTGWTKHGDLKVGDEVFDENGRPTRVVHVHPVETCDTYRVTFQDGAIIDVSGEHLWLTFTSRERAALSRRTPEARARRRATRPQRSGATGRTRPDMAEANRDRAAKRRREGKNMPPPTGRVRTTKQLAEAVRDRRGSPNHAIPMCGALLLPEADLEVAPYTLGAWLGDGIEREGAITSADRGVINAIEADGYTTSPRKSSQRPAKDGRLTCTYGILGVVSKLRAIGVLGSKHIPPKYLRSSYGQRMELLRGLMDTDGHVDGEGRTEFTTTSACLRDGFRELVGTLGLRWSESEGRATIGDRDCGPKYRFRVYGPPGGDNIFKLQRKAELYARRREGTASATRTRWRYIIDIQPIEPARMRCITVENQTGLYQVGSSHIVTHNSWALIYAAVLHGVRTPGWTGLICRSQAVDLDKPGGLWDRAREIAYQTGGRARGGQYRDIHWPGGGRLAFDYVAKGNYQNYRSTELAYLGFDEVNECPMEAVVFLMSRLRTTCGAKPILRMTCNPDPAHEIAKWVDPYYLIDGGERDGCPDRAQSGRVRYFARRAKDDAFIFGDTQEGTADEAEREPWEVKSFTFIDALLDDNPTLAGDEDRRRAYLANIAQQGSVVEAQLRDGNWRATQMPSGILHWKDWGGGETLLEPISPIIRWVRAWDLASTKPRKGYRDPDYTVGVLMGWDAFGRWYVADVVLCRDEAPVVDELLARTASADGPDVLQVIEVEGGASGKRDAKTTRAVLKSGGKCGPIEETRAIKDKATKARGMANELRLGMVGNRPRLTADDKGPKSPRGFLLNATKWMTREYKDDGTHLATVGKIFWQQVRPFPLAVDPATGKKIHDDIPDAMAIAHNAGRPVTSTAPKPASRWDRLS